MAENRQLKEFKNKGRVSQDFNASRNKITSSQTTQDALLDIVDENQLINCLFDSQILRDPSAKAGGANSVEAGSNRAGLLNRSLNCKVTVGNLQVGSGRIHGAMSASVNNDSQQKFSFRNNKYSTLDMPLASPKVPKLDLTPNLKQFQTSQGVKFEDRQQMPE